MAFGRLHEKNRFMSLDSLLKKVKELQEQRLRGEEISFIESNKEEEIDNEMNFEEGETNKRRQEKIKNVLANSTYIHELLAKSFYRDDLVKNI